MGKKCVCVIGGGVGEVCVWWGEGGDFVIL